MTSVLKFEEFITAGADDLLTIDSLRVATVHRKLHKNLLARICKRIELAGEWGLLNFKQTLYIGADGETYPMYVMTKDGYQFLVGRMLAKKAVEHQIPFVAAFNAMSNANLLRGKTGKEIEDEHQPRVHRFVMDA